MPEESVFVSEESQMFKCGGKLQQLTAKFAKGGKAVDCGCNGTKLQNGDKIRKGQDGLQAHADNLDKLGMTRSAAIARGFKSSPNVEEQVVPTNSSAFDATPDLFQFEEIPVEDMWISNRSAKNRAAQTGVYTRGDFRRRANARLRQQNPGMSALERRRNVREMMDRNAEQGYFYDQRYRQAMD